MFKKILYTFIFLNVFTGYTQKEGANWYFGRNAGLNFITGFPVALTDGQLDQLEGCATISDNEGNLLFYTNGINIYNANHVLMQNGGGLLGNDSSSQSAIIVPKPGDLSTYYIFTTDAQGGPNGLNYSTVDMTLDGGLGGVVTTEKNILLHTPVTEKITAVHHENKQDIWVIAHRANSKKFLDYLVTSSGVNTTAVESSVGVFHQFGQSSIGYLKASPNGKKLASAVLEGANALGVQLYDFDKFTGIVSNPINLNTYASYGVEFSPDSKLVYTTSKGYFISPIYQYDITLANETTIQQSQIVITPGIYNYSALQLGIDGKIYVAQYDCL